MDTKPKMPPVSPANAETLVTAATLRDDPPAPGHGDEYVGEALDQCKYGNGADCNNLPLGVRRSPCKPCQARAEQDCKPNTKNQT